MVEDVDALTGEVLEEMFAREVLGWELSRGGYYWLEPWVDSRTGKTYPCRTKRARWHPASQWDTFGWAKEDMWRLGYTVWEHSDGVSSECSVSERDALGLGGRGPLVRQTGGPNVRETALRAFIKAVRRARLFREAVARE